MELDSGEKAHIDMYLHPINSYTVEDIELDGTIRKIVKLSIVGTIKQIPLAPAYAITVHRSQGQTYDKVIVKPNFWTYGQLYVALSRVKTIKGMHLQSQITESMLMVSDKVKEFYRSI